MRTFLLLASYFLLLASHALTREEIIDRFRAVPIVQVEGLVQVKGDCPAEVRRANQLPIASYAADICRSLYASERLKPVRFEKPGIVISFGSDTNNLTNVVSHVVEAEGSKPFTKLYLPSPGYANRRALVCAIARAYFLAVHGKRVSEDEAWHALIASNPELRAFETCEQLTGWSQRGIYSNGKGDEDYLKLARKVLRPGQLTRYELNSFASRLYLYPLSYDAPFCGKYTSLDFATAVRLRKQDLSIRFTALVKAKQVLIFGAGRGEALQSAAEAFAQFLNELARDELSDAELLALLDTAQAKLRICTF